ncbi:hypothetical protein [Sediminibacterium ginsengisoli]|nr:hypothetical protein [Sediminibacterium ginsengisoli]
MNAFVKRYKRKDERTLNDFFGDRKENINYANTIKKFDRDKFKPLNNYLKGISNNTDEKNIELLAWLIDYEPRPHDHNRKAVPELSEIGPEGMIETGNGETGIPIPAIFLEEMFDSKSTSNITKLGFSDAFNHVSKKDIKKEDGIFNIETPDTVIKNPRTKKRFTIASISAVLIISASVYFGRMNISSQTPPSGPQSCMYWNGDHYEATPCNETEGKKLVIALDSLKLRNFKKITQPDTITFRSKGSVWYVKINGGIEYYTSDGFHPVDIRLRLKPITDYMIRKYIYNTQASR